MKLTRSVQQQTGTTISLLKEAIVIAFPIANIADNQVGQVLEVTANLVLSPGLRITGEQRHSGFWGNDRRERQAPPSPAGGKASNSLCRELFEFALLILNMAISRM